jgi:hypothetical protein
LAVSETAQKNHDQLFPGHVSYLGFIFAEGNTHDEVEAALAAAREQLRVVIE